MSRNASALPPKKRLILGSKFWLLLIGLSFYVNIDGCRLDHPWYDLNVTGDRVGGIPRLIPARISFLIYHQAEKLANANNTEQIQQGGLRLVIHSGEYDFNFIIATNRSKLGYLGSANDPPNAATHNNIQNTRGVNNRLSYYKICFSSDQAVMGYLMGRVR